MDRFHCNNIDLWCFWVPILTCSCLFCLIFMSPSNMYNQVQIKEEPRQWPKVLILIFTLQFIAFAFSLFYYTLII
jgi:hypothetical protein